MLKWCIDKLTEVQLDLTEPQDGANLDHQAKKLRRVIDKIERVIGDDEQTPKAPVHGGGTGGQ